MTESSISEPSNNGETCTSLSTDIKPSSEVIDIKSQEKAPDDKESKDEAVVGRTEVGAESISSTVEDSNSTKTEMNGKHDENANGPEIVSGKDDIQPVKKDETTEDEKKVDPFSIDKSEIKCKVSKFLKTADLEQTSAKIVRNHLESIYGGVDLSCRKDVIKSVIQEVMDEMEDNDEGDVEEEEGEEHDGTENQEEDDDNSENDVSTTKSGRKSRGGQKKRKDSDSEEYVEDEEGEGSDANDSDDEDYSDDGGNKRRNNSRKKTTHERLMNESARSGRRKKSESSNFSDEIETGEDDSASESSSNSDDSSDQSSDYQPGDELMRRGRLQHAKRTNPQKVGTRRKRNPSSDDSSGEEWGRKGRSSGANRKSYSAKRPSPKRNRKDSDEDDESNEEEGEDDEHEENDSNNDEDEPSPSSTTKKSNGLKKEYTLSEELAVVVGKEKASRSEVVKLMWVYIKENKLQDPKNKQFAKCDEALYKIIGQKKFRCFGMNKFLTAHMT